MKNKPAITALQKVKQDLIRQRDEVAALAAKPYNLQIADIDKAIESLKGSQTHQALAFGGGEPDYITQGNDTLSYLSIKRRGRPPKNKTYTSYPLTGSIKLKLLFVLKEINRFATIGEIAKKVHLLEPHENETLIKLKFSKHMDKYEAEGAIYKFQVRNSKRNTVYGLPGWYDKVNDKEMPGHEHNPEALIDKKENFLIDTSVLLSLNSQ